MAWVYGLVFFKEFVSDAYAILSYTITYIIHHKIHWHTSHTYTECLLDKKRHTVGIRSVPATMFDDGLTIPKICP